jgi:hypothetical protein
MGEDNLEANPIDLTEMFAIKTDLDFSRVDNNEISVLLKDELPRYILSVIFRADCEIVYFSCDMDLSAPKNKRLAIADAVAKVNEKIWIGHFDLLSDENRVVYSLTIPFMSSFLMDETSVESIIQLITDECNRFYHYFAIIITDNKKTRDSTLNALFLEEAGEA